MFFIMGGIGLSGMCAIVICMLIFSPRTIFGIGWMAYSGAMVALYPCLLSKNTRHVFAYGFALTPMLLYFINPKFFRNLAKPNPGSDMQNYQNNRAAIIN